MTQTTPRVRTLYVDQAGTDAHIYQWWKQTAPLPFVPHDTIRLWHYVAVVMLWAPLKWLSLTRIAGIRAIAFAIPVLLWIAWNFHQVLPTLITRLLFYALFTGLVALIILPSTKHREHAVRHLTELFPKREELWSKALKIYWLPAMLVAVTALMLAHPPFGFGMGFTLIMYLVRKKLNEREKQNLLHAMAGTQAPVEPKPGSRFWQTINPHLEFIGHQ